MFNHRLPVVLLLAGAAGFPVHAADIAELAVNNLHTSAKTDVPVTVGQAFAPGELPQGASLSARADDDSSLPVQVDVKTRHPDDSVRFAVLSFVLPELADGAGETFTLVTPGEQPAGNTVGLDAVTDTSFDATVEVDTGDGTYSASARELLVGNPATWLQGPLVSEWLVSAPLENGGDAHPHLTARFQVRAYEAGRIRVSVAVENTKSVESGRGTFDYDVTVSVDDGEVLSQSNVPHYRQSRWRRVFWYNGDPGVHIAHDSAYLMEIGVVPTYDSEVGISESRIDELWDEYRDGDDLMEVGGSLTWYMPAPGGRIEIAPLPGFTAIYLMTQDVRAKNTMLGYGEQAGTWPVHYRHNDAPISLDDYPGISILGSSPTPSTCEACGSPYTPDVAHQPSLVYVPYLVTGDYYFLEELQFWANYSMFYWGSHGGADGLVVYNQVRGQAWGLRALAEAAWATPDTDGLKSYFTGKLDNNIDWYNANQLDQNPLGFVTRDSGNTSSQISTWQDDFLTWAIGHTAALGFDGAYDLLQWKIEFPVGRMTHPDYCWVLASSSWPYIASNGGNRVDVDSWADFKNNVVWGWPQGIQPNTANEGYGTDLTGEEQALLDAACGSNAMFDLLDIGNDQMIGYQSYEGYPANLQPALATAVDAGHADAETAWSIYVQSASFPDFYNNPQWAITPNSEFEIVPVPPPPPGSSSSSSSSSSGSSSSSTSSSSSSSGSSSSSTSSSSSSSSSSSGGSESSSSSSSSSSGGNDEDDSGNDNLTSSGGGSLGGAILGLLLLSGGLGRRRRTVKATR